MTTNREAALGSGRFKPVEWAQASESWATLREMIEAVLAQLDRRGSTREELLAIHNQFGSLLERAMLEEAAALSPSAIGRISFALFMMHVVTSVGLGAGPMYGTPALVLQLRAAAELLMANSPAYEIKATLS